jgi:CTP:molybdopterin cytidylyltransferase MocA
MMDEIGIAIPAAGASSRMRGRDKLLEPVGGVPLLSLIAARARAVTRHVCVALPGAEGPRHAAIAGLDVRWVQVPDPSEGMAASLRAALAALPESLSGVMILPADMPEIDTPDLRALIDAFRDAPGIWQATAADGTPGHPVIFPADLLGELARVSGDRGGRDLLARHADRLHRLALPGRRTVTDLDTPEDWARWRGAPS